MLYDAFVKEIAEEIGCSQKDAKLVLEKVGEKIARAVADNDSVRIPAIGTFDLRTRPAREGRNPQTGAKMKIAASRTIGFKPSTKAKKLLNK